MTKKKTQMVEISRSLFNDYKIIINMLLKIYLPGKGPSIRLGYHQIIESYFLQRRSIFQIAVENRTSESTVKEWIHKSILSIHDLLYGAIKAAEENVALVKQRDWLKNRVKELETENFGLRLKKDKKLIKEKRFEVSKNMTIQELCDRKLLGERKRDILAIYGKKTTEALKDCTRKELLNLRGFGKAGLNQVEKIIGHPLPKE